MKFQNYKQRFLFYTVVCALVAGAVAGRAAYLQQKQTRPFGFYSREQIIARSNSLCRTLAPQVADLHVTASPYNANLPNSPKRRLWLVDASDERGRYAAFLLWDADTGDLLSANHPSPKTTHTKQNLSQRKALWMARSWMQELGLMPRFWKVDSLPIQNGDAWYTSWRSGKRTATVIVDAHSGQLIRAGAELRRFPAGALSRSL